MANEEVGDAAIHFNRAVVLDPAEVSYYIERAKWYEAQGLQELARQDYQNVLRIDPTYHLEQAYDMNLSEQYGDSINASNKQNLLVLLNKFDGEISLAKSSLTRTQKLLEM